MNRLQFFKTLVTGAVAAPLVAKEMAGRQTDDAPVPTIGHIISKRVHPWQSKLDGKWYGFDERDGQWLEIPDPKQIGKWPV